MQTLREKITFGFTALAFLVFHIRTGPTLGAVVAGTVEQLLTTAPYCIGFTFVLVAIIRYMHDGKRPAWDRICRIYFTIGILFAFYFALYEYGGRAYNEQLKLEGKPVNESQRYQDDNPTVQLY